MPGGRYRSLGSGWPWPGEEGGQLGGTNPSSLTHELPTTTLNAIWYLVHLCPVLQAAAEGVPSQTGDDHQERLDAAVDGGQHNRLGQPGVCGDLSQALAQGGQGLPVVQHT